MAGSSRKTTIGANSAGQCATCKSCKALFVGFHSTFSIPRLELVQLVRIPHCHGQFPPRFDKKPAKSRPVFCTSTHCAFFVPVPIETIHTWASFIDSDSLMARATCNSGRVRREHFGKWPPGRQESCGSRSTAGKKTVLLRPKSR